MDLRRLKKVLKIMVCVSVLVMLLFAGSGKMLFLHIGTGIAVCILIAAGILMLKYGRCPVCSHLLGREYYIYGANYCPNCGKRLP